MEYAESLHWEHFSHGADVGVRGYGRTPEEAFQTAAMALTAVVADPQSVSPTTALKIRCEDRDIELLFLDWMNALVFEMDTKRMLFSAFKVRIADGRLEGDAWGEPLDLGKHEPAVEIKGATMTELKVAESNGRWIAQCVVDV